ncbi:metallophosphoesterase family protein [Candidatus Woesearchaeota archaeon]|nr:metallophosphoesterase family protein [Candidatus Woesearchaeota archaeon]
MRILAVTDSHGSKNHFKEIKQKSKEVDVLVHCGDFTIFGANLKKILKEFNSLKIPVILIPGNHEYDVETRELSSKLKNIFYIHKNSMIVKDIEFFGYGGDGFSLHDKNFVQISKGFLARIEKNRKNGMKNVMLFHGPPFGTSLDDLGNKSYCGNKDYTKFIKQSHVDLAFSGHIHENFGKVDEIKNTKVINPGPDGMIIEI